MEKDLAFQLAFP